MEKWLLGTVFEFEIIDERPGIISAIIKGKNSFKIFSKEIGAHRWQRIPPTETKGRRHTSTITVAVLELRNDPGALFDISWNDIKVETTKGSGPGGQHRNKTDSCVILTHIPTGIKARVDSRSQHQSKEQAYQILCSRLFEEQEEEKRLKNKSLRQEQIGEGKRAEKIRTYREQDDSVIDHRNNKKLKLSKWKACKSNF